MEEEKIREYIEMGGIFCPYCGSDDLKTDPISFAESGDFLQDVHCKSCKKRWTDQYKLTWVFEEDTDD